MTLKDSDNAELNTFRHAVFLVDRDGKVLEINRQAVAVLNSGNWLTIFTKAPDDEKESTFIEGQIVVLKPKLIQNPIKSAKIISKDGVIECAVKDAAIKVPVTAVGTETDKMLSLNLLNKVLHSIDAPLNQAVPGKRKLSRTPIHFKNVTDRLFSCPELQVVRSNNEKNCQIHLNYVWYPTARFLLFVRNKVLKGKKTEKMPAWFDTLVHYLQALIGAGRSGRTQAQARELVTNLLSSPANTVSSHVSQICDEFFNTTIQPLNFAEEFLRQS